MSSAPAVVYRQHICHRLTRIPSIPTVRVPQQVNQLNSASTLFAYPCSPHPTLLFTRIPNTTFSHLFDAFIRIGGTSYYFKAGTASCYPIVSTSNVIQYYLRTVCSSTESTATVDLYSDSTCTTLYSTVGVAVTAAAACTLETYATTASPLFLSSGDSQYQKSTCVGPAPTGQPSTQPSTQPSRQPSNQPTMRPSRQPSAQVPTISFRTSP